MKGNKMKYQIIIVNKMDRLDFAGSEYAIFDTRAEAEEGIKDLQKLDSFDDCDLEVEEVEDEEVEDELLERLNFSHHDNLENSMKVHRDADIHDAFIKYCTEYNIDTRELDFNYYSEILSCMRAFGNSPDPEDTHFYFSISLES